MEDSVKIRLTSLFVDDQAKALDFYTNVMGFVLKRDLPAGEARWLTVVSPDEPDGVELVLEPRNNPAATTFALGLRELHDHGIPWTIFYVDDVQQEFERLKAKGVVFTVEPVDIGPATIAIFDDTCGNLIQIFKPKTAPSGAS
jgi:predicted enzyme related to lactoylglutathione lyase